MRGAIFFGGLRAFDAKAFLKASLLVAARL
jgi:hypothetical protein